MRFMARRTKAYRPLVHATLGQIVLIRDIFKTVTFFKTFKCDIIRSARVWDELRDRLGLKVGRRGGRSAKIPKTCHGKF